jgi:steroid 5-alpha reductase family enzyme
LCLRFGFFVWGFSFSIFAWDFHVRSFVCGFHFMVIRLRFVVWYFRLGPFV